MISSTQALAEINATVRLMTPILLPLTEAAGLVLASDAMSRIDVPPFAQSSMDGYAVRHDEYGRTLAVQGESAAGAAIVPALSPGHAMRIFTGAALPEGADSVVMQEDAVREADTVRFTLTEPVAGQHVRQRGAEIASGETALTAGTRLTSTACGFLAMAGIAEVSIHPLPRVGLIVTGDEIVPLGAVLPPGGIYDANSVALSAALAERGITLIATIHVRDDPAALSQAIDDLTARCDVLLLTGGVSVGDHDHVLTAAGAAGIRTVFHRVRQKPGKPLFFGERGETLVFGLPGNPASVLTCFHAYVVPALDRMRGKLSGKPSMARLGAPVVKPAGIAWFLKGRLESEIAMPLGGQESYRLRTFAEANVLIRLDESRSDHAAGEPVVVLPLATGG